MDQNQLAQLNERFAELSRDLQQEHQLRLALEDRLAAMTKDNPTGSQTTPTAQQPATTTPPHHAPALTPKMAAPTPFDGTRGTLAEAFISQVHLYITVNAARFPNDHSKVAFALSYLTGNASSWARPYTIAAVKGQPVSFDQFNIDFEAMYFDTTRKDTAIRTLRSLRQTKSVADYTYAFNCQAPLTGYRTEDLIDLYRLGLKSEIHSALIMHPTPFTTLTEITNLAIKLDNALNGARHFQPFVGSNTSNAPRPDPDAMDISAATTSLPDRSEMRARGLCFHCGKSGHLYSACPDRPKPRNNRKQRTFQVSELAAEIDKILTQRSTGQAGSSKNGGAQE